MALLEVLVQGGGGDLPPCVIMFCVDALPPLRVPTVFCLRSITQSASIVLMLNLFSETHYRLKMHGTLCVEKCHL